MIRLRWLLLVPALIWPIVASAELRQLERRLEQAREPLVRERIQEAIAERTEDGLAAYDRWLMLARSAQDAERQRRAARRAAILALMLGQAAASTHLPQLEDAELRYALALTTPASRAEPPLLLRDEGTRRAVAARVGGDGDCPSPDPLVCPRLRAP